jgi:hypothetical protein
MSKIWKVRLIEPLQDYEIFTGITSANFLNSKNNIEQGFVGVVEKWESASKCIKRNAEIEFYQEELG